ncbi:ABC transporter ATP-binding protein [Noviherbaspirillum saxi]|uniref:ABC transporter ATP-binding protein n=1 Tax=Noviherbaspirillum saxi TaxID=2320863 RepID=A0A3A3FHD7_9BURK|nr:ABC transporter ATP-binding protein [Noviherbaspirillum saxi]RJF91798.1 ABC transporter ATP-binding protein [Noviherbaspirillum saxi]
MLELNNVSSAYGRVPMLRNVTLDVKQGEVVCLLGPNGAGKTTLFRVITDLVRPTEGEVKLLGRKAGEVGTERIAALGVGLVPEGRRLFPQLTVLENLRLGFDAVTGGKNRHAFEQRLHDTTALFPRVRERLLQPAGTLSGGEQAMVALVRAMIGQPQMIIMDEPSLGLSPKLIDEYFEVTHEISRQGTTVLLIEQNAEKGLGIADRGYLMVKGRVVAAGKADELLDSKVIEDAYF